MKTTRRIFSMVLALMMVLSLSVTAFADTTTGTATIKIVEVKDEVTTELATTVRRPGRLCRIMGRSICAWCKAA